MRLCVNLGNFHAKNSFQFSLKIIVRSQHSLLLVLRRNGRISLEIFLSNILTIVMRLIKYYLAPLCVTCNQIVLTLIGQNFFVKLSHDARMIGMFTEMALIGEF